MIKIICSCSDEATTEIKATGEKFEYDDNYEVTEVTREDIKLSVGAVGCGLIYLDCQKCDKRNVLYI